MTKMNLKENDKIKISIANGKMTIEKINRPKYLNLAERLEAFYNKPIDEIYVENTQEVDAGAPAGEDVYDKNILLYDSRYTRKKDDMIRCQVT